VRRIIQQRTYSDKGERKCLMTNYFCTCNTARPERPRLSSFFIWDGADPPLGDAACVTLAAADVLLLLSWLADARARGFSWFLPGDFRGRLRWEPTIIAVVFVYFQRPPPTTPTLAPLGPGGPAAVGLAANDKTPHVETWGVRRPVSNRG
jgi:hypothetical protein